MDTHAPIILPDIRQRNRVKKLLHENRRKAGKALSFNQSRPGYELVFDAPSTPALAKKFLRESGCVANCSIIIEESIWQEIYGEKFDDLAVISLSFSHSPQDYLTQGHISHLEKIGQLSWRHKPRLWLFAGPSWACDHGVIQKKLSEASGYRASSIKDFGSLTPAEAHIWSLQICQAMGIRQVILTGSWKERLRAWPSFAKALGTRNVLFR